MCLGCKTTSPAARDNYDRYISPCGLAAQRIEDRLPAPVGQVQVEQHKVHRLSAGQYIQRLLYRCCRENRVTLVLQEPYGSDATWRIVFYNENRRHVPPMWQNAFQDDLALPRTAPTLPGRPRPGKYHGINRFPRVNVYAPIACRHYSPPLFRLDFYLTYGIIGRMFSICKTWWNAQSPRRCGALRCWRPAKTSGFPPLCR